MTAYTAPLEMTAKDRELVVCSFDYFRVARKRSPTLIEVLVETTLFDVPEGLRRRGHARCEYFLVPGPVPVVEPGVVPFPVPEPV